jgi:hypothetical protein
MRAKVMILLAAGSILLPVLSSAQRGAAVDQPYLSVDEALERLDRSIPKNSNGQIGALAPANLNAERPEPPFNLTGTWFVDLASKGFGDFMFGPPYPEFIGQAAEDFAEGQRVRAAGGTYRDAIGQCYPAGVPMIMTRIWPIMMVQLPTAIYMVTNFNNSFRQIFLDGRDYSDPNTVIYTYNGESLGHWEGDTLVADTRYIETWNHYIDSGIPISEEFRVQERFRMTDEGRALEIEYIMTDPLNWVGEWRSTKRWLRVDTTDIGEVECLPDLNDNLPSTQSGQLGLSN